MAIFDLTDKNKPLLFCKIINIWTDFENKAIKLLTHNEGSDAMKKKKI